MRLSGLRVCEWVARARPRGIEGDTAHDTMIRVIAITDIGVEGEEDVGLGGADLAHELLPQLQALDQLGVWMAQEGDAFHTHHIRSRLLLALAKSRHLRT